MFWRFGGYANISTIDTILDKPDFTLEDLLDEGDLIQELKQHNTKLIEYLREDKALKKLLEYAVAPQLEKCETPADNDDDSGESRGRLLSFSRPRASSRATDATDNEDDEQQQQQKKHNRYAFVACEILSSDTWSIYEALTENRQLIRDFWGFLARPSPLDPLQASYFTKINESLFEKKTEEMMELLRELPDAVPNLLKHVECPMIMDLLLKIIALDRSEGGQGIVEWLYSKNIIPTLLSCLAPEHSWVMQTAAGDFIKAIITISANASQNEQQCIGPNELTRQLVSKPCVDQLVSYMLGGGNPLTVGVGIIIEVIRKNNSDYDPDVGTESTSPPSSHDPIYLGTLLRLFAENVPNFMNLIMGSPEKKRIESTFGEKLEPLGFDRFKTCELMAELLHCSNMGLLNEPGSEQLIATRDAERRRLRADGKLGPQRDEDPSTDDLTMRMSHPPQDETRLQVTNADDDGFEEVQPSKEMSEDTSHEFVKAEAVASPPTQSSSLLDKDEDDFVEEPLSSPRLAVTADKVSEQQFDEPDLIVAPLSPSKPRLAEPVLTPPTEVPAAEAKASEAETKAAEPTDAPSPLEKAIAIQDAALGEENLSFTPSEPSVIETEAEAKTEKVAEDKPAEDKPVEDKPTEDKPVEDKSGEDKSSEDKSGDDKPVEDKASDDKSGEEADLAKDRAMSPHPEDVPAPLFSAPTAPDSGSDKPPQLPARTPPVESTESTNEAEGKANADESTPADTKPEATGSEGLKATDIPEAPVVGDFLKIQFVEHKVVPTILSFFFSYPWNNFLHNVVYDIVQQVFNGPMDRGYNPTLAISLFEAADVTAAIINGQKVSDESHAKTKTRMGYMGHLTLIAEEVVKFTERHPPELLSETVLDKVMSQDWINYVEGALAETRERDNAILGGVRPEVALGHRGSLGGGGLGGVGLSSFGTNTSAGSNALAEAGLNGGIEMNEGGNNGIGPFAISAGTLMSGFGSSSDEEDEEGEGEDEDVNSEFRAYTDSLNQGGSMAPPSIPPPPPPPPPLNIPPSRARRQLAARLAMHQKSNMAQEPSSATLHNDDDDDDDDDTKDPFADDEDGFYDDDDDDDDDDAGKAGRRAEGRGAWWRGVVRRRGGDDSATGKNSSDEDDEEFGDFAMADEDKDKEETASNNVNKGKVLLKPLAVNPAKDGSRGLSGLWPFGTSAKYEGEGQADDLDSPVDVGGEEKKKPTEVKEAKRRTSIEDPDDDEVVV